MHNICHINLNSVTGELERSKFVRFCRGQNLRHLFNEAQLPDEIHPILDIFESRYKVKIRGTLLDDVGLYGIEKRTKRGGKQLNIDEKHIACMRDWLYSNDNELAIKSFIPSRVVVLQHVERNGRRYQSDGDSNSLIIFSSSAEATPQAGRIVLLFSYASHTFAILSPFKKLGASHHQFDFTLGLANGVGYLSDAEVESTLTLVHFSKILSHFASISVNTEPSLLHILPI